MKRPADPQETRTSSTSRADTSTASAGGVLEALKALPREAARPGFEERVLGRVRQSSARAPSRWPGWLLVPGLAAAGLLAGLAAGFWSGGESPRSPGAGEPAPLVASADRAALERRYEALERELAELRLQAAEARPMVGFVGRDDVDVVVDLEELMARPGFQAYVLATSAGADTSGGAGAVVSSDAAAPRLAGGRPR